MVSFFRKSKPSVFPITTDIHSHLLPGIDDGVQDLEQAVFAIKQMHLIGYKKFITTPHVMNDFFPNNARTIKEKLNELKAELKFLEIPVQVEAAAEYYLDDYLLYLLDLKDEILTFGDSYILFETSFINEPAYLREALFKINSIGLKPVLAHPERYLYLHRNHELLDELYDRGVLFQINLLSLSGYYSAESKKFAEKLIDKKMVNFIGSDLHTQKHVETIVKSTNLKYFKKVLGLDLLNNTL
ncbi:MAG: capsular biosynthesis protein [Bacteroidota bacterium]|jgi:tyrosine-protein phosphatase YwqE|nr:capsular biosynthesis protein [Bacteroidota bacterium]